MNRIGPRPTGAALFAAVVRDPNGPSGKAFDNFFYDLVLRYVKKRHRLLGQEAGRLTGAGGNLAPALPPDRIDEAAHMTAVIALRRAKKTARSFDPAAGSAEAWILRSAALAYVEVAQDLTDFKRRLTAVPTEEGQLTAAADAAREACDVAELIARRQLISDAFAALPDDERRALILTRTYGYSYSAAADLMFGEPGETKKIDLLLQAAARKLARVRADNPA
jgi:DNA-directed RNA polymerase specialized sigma24 family protein